VTVVEISPSRRPSETHPMSLFSTPATAAGPPPPATPIRKFILPFVAGAALAFGTVASVSAVDVAAYEARVVQSGTRADGPPAGVQTVTPQDVAGAVQELRHASGLTWDEIAGSLGVSRRAIHHWAAGALPSARHAARLGALVRLVASYATGDSAQTRSRLIAPDARGYSPLSLFSRAGRQHRWVSLSSQSLGEILEASLAEDQGTAPPPLSRASSLHARPIGAVSQRRRD
jgi:transcriptional regulator with XRE-family HTH domain